MNLGLPQLLKSITIPVESLEDGGKIPSSRLNMLE